MLSRWANSRVRAIRLGLLGLFVVAVMLLGACRPTANETTTSPEHANATTGATTDDSDGAERQAPTPETGTETNPIQVLFAPPVSDGGIEVGSEVMAQALGEVTGYTFKANVLASYAAVADAICASPNNTMAFIPALGYVVANRRCGAEIGAAAVQDGLSWHTGMYLVRRDSVFKALEDLADTTWAYSESDSALTRSHPLSEFRAAGIEPGQQLAVSSHSEAILAVYYGEADVATAPFTPPIMPGNPDYRWQVGDEPEPWDVDPTECFVSEQGALICGQFQVLDARKDVTYLVPDVVAKTRILALSPGVADTVSFGPGFPQELRTEIIDALIVLAETETWQQTIGSEEFYGWSGLEPVDDSTYNPVRILNRATWLY